jgi:uncharacterized membrane protein
MTSVGVEQAGAPSQSGVRVRECGRVTSAATRAVYISAAVYGLLFAVAVVLFYVGFHEERLDVGDMVQAIWSTTHGHFLEFTTPEGLQASRLGVHTDVFLLFLVPLWLVWPSPIVPLVLQPLAVASGALPVYWLARKHLGNERAAVFLSFAYLLYPATQFNAFTPTSGFHPISFAVPLILFAIWFLDEDRLVPFAVCALLAATTKEEIPLAVGCLGLWYAFSKGRRRVGLAIFGVGAAASLLAFVVIIPHFSRPGYAPFAERYSTLGGNAHRILHTAVTDPGALVHTVATPHKAVYLLFLFCPLLGLAFRAPLLLLGAVPDLVINLLSVKPSSTVIGTSYTAGILPFLIAATVFGLKKVKRDRREVSLFALAAVAAIAINSPIVANARTLGASLTSDPARDAQAHAVRLIPHDIPVAATHELAGYLSARRYVYIFPYVRSARWLVVNENDTRTLPNLRSFAQRWMNAHPEWRTIYHAQGVYVLRKVK